MAAPRHPRGLPTDAPVVLPSHGPAADFSADASRLSMYSIRATDDLLDKMRDNDPVIVWDGVGMNYTLSVGGEDMQLKYRAEVGDGDASGHRFVLSHRHGDDVRSAGIMSGELDPQRKLGQGDKDRTKKRTLDATNQKKSSAMVMADIDEPKHKRSRRAPVSSKPVTTRLVSTKPVTTKRPRARASASPLNGLSMPTPAPGGPVRRMAAPVMPASVPSHSHVSPPELSGSREMAARAAAALGNGLRPPRSIPPSAHGIPASARVSAAPSPVASRGPSPARLSSAPTSPRTGALPSPAVAGMPPSSSPNSRRSKEDIQRHLTHLLALQPMGTTEVKNRLGSICSDFDSLRKGLQVIGTLSAGSKYKLKPAKWTDVSGEYELYSLPERDFIRRELANRRAGGTVTGSGSSQGSVVSPSTGDGSPGAAVAAGARKSAAAAGSRAMNGSTSYRAKVAPLDPELDKFVSKTLSSKVRSERTVKAIASSADDARYRSEFEALWKRYCALHDAMVTIQNDITAVRIRRNIAQFGELHALDAETTKFVRAVKDRWERYTEALQRVHNELELLKSRIADYCEGGRR